MIALLDMILFGRLRAWYFTNVRGNYVKSYRIVREDLGAGTSITMWRWKIEVRYKYKWYHSSNDGYCEAEEFNLKPDKEFFKDWTTALLKLNKIIHAKPNRETYHFTNKAIEKPDPYCSPMAVDAEGVDL